MQKCECLCSQTPLWIASLSPLPGPRALQILGKQAHLGGLQVFPTLSFGAQEPFSLLEGNTTVGISSQPHVTPSSPAGAPSADRAAEHWAQVSPGSAHPSDGCFLEPRAMEPYHLLKSLTGLGLF